VAIRIAHIGLDAIDRLDQHGPCAEDNMAKFRIDVLIPVFNAYDTVVGSVRSIQDQTIKDIRIILINDGSTDNTLKQLEIIRSNDPRVLIINKENSGIVDALNLGLSYCDAEFIARHDADDISYPDRFQLQLDYLDANPSCLAVSCQARHIDQAGRWLGTVTRIPDPALSDPTAIPSREPYLMHPFLMVRRHALEAVGGYRHVHHAEDTDLYWRLQERGELGVVPNILGDYRYSSASITSRSILNGRLSAINSQLAAISASRRRGGEPDLDFPTSRITEMSEAQTTPDIFRVACRSLKPLEIEYLQYSFSAKILELTAYRPFELDQTDCDFISQKTKRISTYTSKHNLSAFRRLKAIAAARLLTKGRFNESLKLLSSDIWLQTLFLVSLGSPLKTILHQVRRYRLTLKGVAP